MTLPGHHHFWAAVVALGLCASLTASHAQTGGSQARHWIYSGSELIEALEGRQRGADAGSETLNRTLSSARAQAYIAGVADATSGKWWCSAGRVLPHELSDHVYAYTRSLPPQRLTESAATLVAEALAQAFPCATR